MNAYVGAQPAVNLLSNLPPLKLGGVKRAGVAQRKEVPKNQTLNT